MKAYLIISPFVLGLMSAFLISADHKDVVFSGSTVSWLSNLGLLPWEQALFFPAPDAYQMQFIAIALVLSVPIVGVTAFYYFTQYALIRDQIINDSHKSEHRLVKIPYVNNIRYRLLISSVLIICIFYFGRFVMMLVFARDADYYIRRGMMVPWDLAANIFAPPLMVIATQFLALFIAIGIGGLFVTEPDDVRQGS